MDYGGKDGPSSNTGGVKPFPIEGRFGRVRERLAGGFTDEDRIWRAKFLKDQHLHNEPITPDWYYKERYNPIRRFYRWPLETIFKTQEPNVPWIRFAARYWTGKALIIVSLAYTGYYIHKYHNNDWTNVSGMETIASKPIKFIGQPGYGEREILTGPDYYDNRQGFNKSPI